MPQRRLLMALIRPRTPGIILADQQRDVLGHFVGIATRAPSGAVPRQHFLLLLIKHQLELSLTGGGLPRALRGFAFCGDLGIKPSLVF